MYEVFEIFNGETVHVAEDETAAFDWIMETYGVLGQNEYDVKECEYD